MSALEINMLTATELKPFESKWAMAAETKHVLTSTLFSSHQAESYGIQIL